MYETGVRTAKWLCFWSKGVFEDFDKVQKLESILNERIWAVRTVTLLNYCYFYTVDYIQGELWQNLFCFKWTYTKIYAH